MQNFVKMKSTGFHTITLLLTNIGNHALVSILNVASMSLIAIHENKILAKISEFSVVRAPPKNVGRAL